VNLRRAVWTLGDRLGAFAGGRLLFSLKHGTGYVRAINYHATPAHSADNFRSQLEFYRDHFGNVSSDALDDCLAGRRQADKPGLLVTFDDGCRSNYDVAAPLLEQYGFTGWFFVSPGHVGSKAPDNHDWPGEDFMTYDQLRDLHARGHVIGCHTHSHVRLADDLTPEQLDDEIVASRRRLEAGLGQPVDTFCWVGGDERSYGAGAARVIAAANYRYVFMTNLSVLSRKTDPLWLDRTNIEADWPLPRVRFYLSGLMDLRYLPKRARIRKKLPAAYRGRR
jgi:peptidoglycan/xylan/chitin deacetylase (PgdA/CDA1 family)